MQNDLCKIRSDLDNMLTTIRHSQLLSKLTHEIMDKTGELHTNKILLGRTSLSLVYYGNLTSSNAKLVDLAKETDNLQCFATKIDNLSYIQPNLFLFQQNKWAKNTRNTRFAGYPDFVAEIFSESNKEPERQAKKQLYGSSPITEHWYLTQDSNIVERWLGKNRLEDLTLEKILVTQYGLKIDLTRLAL
ncbi:MAG: Uma2 family endonuclease [Firmicutes bacterium]|nr:Uma2 family endonuclease [Bacillota bacterium]